MDERGTVLPAILALAFGGLLLLGVAIDLTRWASSHREAAFAADAGAQAGAATVSEDSLRLGVLAVDEGLALTVAVQVAEAARPRLGRIVRVVVTGNQVCVEVEQPFAPGLGAALPISTGPVRAHSCAAPARG